VNNRKVGSWCIGITSVVLLLVMAFPHTAYADTSNSTYETNENGNVIIDNEGTGEVDGQPADPSVKSNNPVIGITLDKTSATLMGGQSIRLIPSISPTEADNKNICWTSSDTDTATVDETGWVNATGEGTVVITATTQDGSFTATCEVNVFEKMQAPGNELAVAQGYNTIKVTWSEIEDADGYEVYRSDTVSGKYKMIAQVQSAKYSDTGLKVGKVYYYKVRAYQTINDSKDYSEDTPAISAKTLDKNIGSSLFLYMSDLNNRNSVYNKAVILHNGNPKNTCALTVSEAFRRIKLNIPTSTCRTNQVEDHLAARGWKKKMDLNLLQPGDICFTTDANGKLLGGHATHTFIFMGWANKEKTLMNICDNQRNTYGGVFHERTIFRSKRTDATAFFYHTKVTDVGSIFKIISTVKTNPVSNNKVKISWGTASGAYGYNIYRATSKNGVYRNIASTRSTVFTDSHLSTGKTYYYKVRAYGKLGTSKIYGICSPVYAATPNYRLHPLPAIWLQKEKQIFPRMG
jgi:fibronectin type 3 domain-containing protein